MAIVRWDPFADLRTLHSQVDDMFNQMFTGTSNQLAPTTDVYTEDDKTMVIEAHLPNFKEDEVSLDVHQGALEIRAEHTEKEEDKGKKKYLVRESSSSFYRRIALPERADDDNIAAHFKDGVLKITVPFKELPKPKQIAIEGGSKKK
ncbi:MAG TPA: Hsp20/alpha crystallin family protein [Candidatus Saccharimonadales bacterium]|nr:Hsp20/alpha crystallin family protein [Candidatus Saccharimonadales bacterium]